jgi:hypothetical protein
VDFSGGDASAVSLGERETVNNFNPIITPPRREGYANSWARRRLGSFNYATAIDSDADTVNKVSPAFCSRIRKRQTFGHVTGWVELAATNGA